MLQASGLAPEQYFPRWLVAPNLGWRRSVVLDVRANPGKRDLRAEDVASLGALIEAFRRLKLRLRGRAVQVRVDPALLLGRDVALPKRAVRDAERIIALDLAQNTPGGADGVFWSQGPWQAEGGSVRTTAYLIRPEIVATLQAGLRTAGAHSIEVVPALKGYQRAFATSGATDGHAIRRNLLLAMALFAGAAGVDVFAAVRDGRALEARLSGLQTETSALTSSLAGLSATSAETRANLDAERAAQLALSDPSPMLFLGDVTEALDPSSWVSDWRLEPGYLSLQGQTKSGALELVTQLGRLPWVSEVETRGAFVRDQRTGAERFDLVLRLSVGAHDAE